MKDFLKALWSELDDTLSYDVWILQAPPRTQAPYCIVTSNGGTVRHALKDGSGNKHAMVVHSVQIALYRKFEGSAYTILDEMNAIEAALDRQALGGVAIRRTASPTVRILDKPEGRILQCVQNWEFEKHEVIAAG